MKSGVVDILCGFLAEDSVKLKCIATQALANLSADKENIAIIAEAAGTTSLIQQLLSSKQELQVSLSLSLSFFLSLSHSFSFSHCGLLVS
jgi:hypothetical protein